MHQRAPMRQRLNLILEAGALLNLSAARISLTGRRTRRSGGQAQQAGHVAMAAAVLWLLVSGLPGTASGGIMTCLVIVAPLIAATAADARRTALVAGTTLTLTIAAWARHGHIQDQGRWTGL